MKIACVGWGGQGGVRWRREHRKLDICGILPIGNQRLWNRRDGQNIIDQAGGNCAARHAGVLSLFGQLNHNNAAALFDALAAACAIGATAREHYGGGEVAVRFGERAEEEIDWRMQSARIAAFVQLDGAIDHRQILGWWDDIDLVWHDCHGLGDLDNLHGGGMLEQRRGQALVGER